MAQEDKNSLAEWFVLVREQIPHWRAKVGLWWEAVKEDPRALWHTVPVRYATYALGGLLCLWTVGAIANAIAPAPPADARPQATTADFHAICIDPNCNRQFIINEKFGFDDFPVTCPACRAATGQLARKCFSESCRGTWRPTDPDADKPQCTQCGAPMDQK